jgi:hypothetical protein
MFPRAQGIIGAEGDMDNGVWRPSLVIQMIIGGQVARYLKGT